MKDKRAIPILVKTMSDENKFITRNAYKSLIKITGQNFGEDVAKWQQWWNADKDRILKEIESEKKKEEQNKKDKAEKKKKSESGQDKDSKPEPSKPSPAAPEKSAPKQEEEMK